MESSEQTSDQNHYQALAIAWTGGSVAGWLLGGWILSVVLGVAAPVAVAIVVAVRKAKEIGAALDHPVPDVSALPARQALAALSAATQGAANFDSPQLRALDKLDEQADGDAHRALALAEALMEAHQRSAAVAAELARRHAAVGNAVQTRRYAALSVTLALNGGMNPMAAKLLAEFKPHREFFALSTDNRRRLAGAAEANADDSGAAWCRTLPDNHPL